MREDNKVHNTAKGVSQALPTAACIFKPITRSTSNIFRTYELLLYMIVQWSTSNEKYRMTNID